MTALKGTVFVGDSLTARWPVSSYVRGAFNAGYPGYTTKEIYPRFFSEGLNKNPKRIVLLAGTNDVFRASRVNTDLIRRMALAADARRVPVILCKLPPIVTDAAALNAGFASAVLAANAALVALAASGGWKLADYYGAMVSGGVQIAAYFIDGVHPSPAGYDAMWAALQPLLT